MGEGAKQNRSENSSFFKKVLRGFSTLSGTTVTMPGHIVLLKYVLYSHYNAVDIEST